MPDWADEKAKGIQQSLCRQGVSLLSSRAADTIADALREAHQCGVHGILDASRTARDAVAAALPEPPKEQP